jgi:hypothetical protein
MIAAELLKALTHIAEKIQNDTISHKNAKYTPEECSDAIKSLEDSNKQQAKDIKALLKPPAATENLTLAVLWPILDVAFIYDPEIIDLLTKSNFFGRADINWFEVSSNASFLTNTSILDLLVKGLKATYDLDEDRQYFLIFSRAIKALNRNPSIDLMKLWTLRTANRLIPLSELQLMLYRSTNNCASEFDFHEIFDQLEATGKLQQVAKQETPDQYESFCRLRAMRKQSAMLPDFDGRSSASAAAAAPHPAPELELKQSADLTRERAKSDPQRNHWYRNTF